MEMFLKTVFILYNGTVRGNLAVFWNIRASYHFSFTSFLFHLDSIRYQHQNKVIKHILDLGKTPFDKNSSALDSDCVTNTLHLLLAKWNTHQIMKVQGMVVAYMNKHKPSFVNTGNWITVWSSIFCS